MTEPIPPIPPFHIMCKPVSGTCNLACRYCYYTMKPRDLYPDVRRPVMTEATLETYTRQYLEAMPVRCEFGWQGGEPLLAGLPFFRRAVEMQREFGRPGQVVSNGLQTNGTLLTDEWCDFLAEHRFLVGLSLDGPARVHDVHRVDAEGRPTWSRAWAALERMTRRGVEFNVLATLNAANVSHMGNVYRYFVNRGVRYLQFIPILERRPGTDEPAAYSCPPAALARGMLEVFEQWAARDVGRVSVRFIDDALHVLLYGRASTCVHSDRCAAGQVLEFNGDLYACDHFVYREWLLGNVTRTPLVDLLRSPLLAEFAALKTDLPAACRDCEVLRFCRGGCPKHHRPMGRDPGRVNYFCEAYRGFYTRAAADLERIAGYLRRGERPPVAPPKTGPNDPCPCGSGRKFKACCGRGGR